MRGSPGHPCYQDKVVILDAVKAPESKFFKEEPWPGVFFPQCGGCG